MISLNRIADIVEGVVQGDGDYKINAIDSLEQATGDSISFYCNHKHKKQLAKTRAGAILITASDAELFSGNRIVVTDPYLAYARISKLFKKYPRNRQIGIDDTAIVHPGAVVGDSVSIGQYSTVAEGASIENRVVVGNCVNIGEDVHIGDDTVIQDQVVVAEGCHIGKRCFISPGAVIGASGFGYAPQQQRWEKIEQLGSVLIGNDVDIGANTTIDRGALDNTIIGNGVKLDNHIQVGHNAEIGENSILAAFVGISGSVKIGKRCKIGARAGFVDHLDIADDVTIIANASITKSINSSEVYSSLIPAQPARQWRKNAAIIRRLDKLVEKVKKLGDEN